MTLQKMSTSKKGYHGGKGRAVYVSIAVWRKGDAIHLTGNKEINLHTSINCKAGSARYHKNLFNKLKKILQEKDCWDVVE